MRGLVFLLNFIFIKWFLLKINAEEKNITFPIIIANDTDAENSNEKSILRYGHHRTHKCQNFKKTYICVNECLKRKYDIASADENCKCTCFYDKVKAQYYGHKDDWKMPTFKIPAAWAKDHTEKNQEYGDISVDEKHIINVANISLYLKNNNSVPADDNKIVINSTEADNDTETASDDDYQGNFNGTDNTNGTSDEESQKADVDEDAEETSSDETPSNETISEETEAEEQEAEETEAEEQEAEEEAD